MADDEIYGRLKRIYSAIDTAEEKDLDSIKPTIIQDSQTVTITQDFSGNLSEAQLWNIVTLLIDNVASLYNHLKRWAKQDKLKTSKIDKVFNDSRELKVIHDLWNNDKHGYPPRNGGHSGISPKITKVFRAMQITTLSKEPGTAVSTLDFQGTIYASETAGLGVVVSGTVADGDGNDIGNLYLIALKSLETWEGFLSDYGIK